MAKLKPRPKSEPEPIPVKPPKKRKPPAVDPVPPKADETITQIITTLGAPTGTIPRGKIGGGGPWSLVNRFDPIFVSEGVKHGVDPAMLKSMMIVETGGKDVSDAHGASGVMQFKKAVWGERARKAGYDLDTDNGQVGMAAALLGGSVPGVRGTTPMERFLYTYYPILNADGSVCWDCKGESGHTPRMYVDDIALYTRLINEAATKPAKPVITPAPEPKPDLDPWRPYPFPKMVDVHVKKPGERAGFDRVAPRGPRIVGSCNHITDGRGSIEWYRDFFGTGGERAWDALTDTVIGRDGRIGLLNDWRNPDYGGRRAGWANGTATGIEGDGLAFYRRYPDINDVLVSKEHEARAGEPLTDDQFEASVEFSTANAQAVKCPWDTYPYHPGFGGVNIEQMHFLFAPKACPAEPFISTYYPRLVREVKAKLKAWQGGIAGPPVEPVKPVWYTRFGFSLDEIRTFFGIMRRHNADGTVDELPFDSKGALSLLWLERCDREGVFPESERIWTADAQFVDGTERWASWVGGWMAYLPLAESAAVWRWLDQPEAA